MTSKPLSDVKWLLMSVIAMLALLIGMTVDHFWLSSPITGEDCREERNNATTARFQYLQCQQEVVPAAYSIGCLAGVNALQEQGEGSLTQKDMEEFNNATSRCFELRAQFARERK